MQMIAGAIVILAGAVILLGGAVAVQSSWAPAYWVVGCLVGLMGFRTLFVGEMSEEASAARRSAAPSQPTGS